MSAHDECSRPGKFDCAADEKINEITFEECIGEGDVQADCAWFAPVSLGDLFEGDLIKHYGTRWLIARENSDGRFWVECYDTEAARAERVEGLRASWNEWAGELL